MSECVYGATHISRKRTSKEVPKMLSLTKDMFLSDVISESVSKLIDEVEGCRVET